MSFISESQLSEYRSSTKLFSSQDFVNLNESNLKDKTRPMVFLSHKHEEVKVLQDVIAFLKKKKVLMLMWIGWIKVCLLIQMPKQLKN
jgi:ABC-type Na+ transport system ATPase subunit NatA